jgi:transcriptional antiterminator RfaH
MSQTHLGSLLDPCWYVVSCKARNEVQTAVILSTCLGIVTYLPTLRQRLLDKVQEAALFPGYVFVHLALRDVPPSRINSIPGVIRLLEFGGIPQAVPDAIVAAIREEVEQINAQGGLPAHHFQPGDNVRLTSGPLCGLEAVFLGSATPRARVRILLKFLSRLNEVQVDVGTLERIETPLRAKHERHTRGKGRYIHPHPGPTKGSTSRGGS